MPLFTDALSLNVLIIIGICFVARFFYSSIVFAKKTIYLYLISKNRLNPKNYGEWSVVTGATNGIGNCFAELLAKRGSNLVVIGRNEESLINMKLHLATSKKAAKTLTLAY
ncbi:hypothetical protein MXB_1577 [Myxobolus squamalis]|nr:hypothetical protein MXB_1577 [Myxobolus squamalis]